MDALDDVDDEDRRLLGLARDARSPGAEDKARVEARLALLLGISGAAATTSVAAPAAAANAGGLAGKAAGTAAALKWTLGGCALLAAALATYAVLPRSANPPAPAHVGPPAVMHDSVPPSPAPPEVEVSAQPVAAPPAPALADPEPVAQPARTPRHAHARPGRDTERESGALGAELELLHSAQSAWRAGDAARALALVAEHRTRHPRSALGLERDALRVLALCDLGRTREAVRLGRAWLSRAPSSPLRASVERSCAMK